MKEVLDRSKTQMILFVNSIEVDRTLPKWSSIEGVAEKQALDAVGVKDIDVGLTSLVTSDAVFESTGINIIDKPIDYRKAEEIKQKLSTYSPKKASMEDIDKMSIRDFNIYLDSQRLKRVQGMWKSGDTMDIFAPAVQDNYEQNIFRRLKNIFGVLKDEREELRKLDVLDFFSNVKLISKQAQDKYVKRVAPIIYALKDAEEIGQKGLADALIGQMYRERYESELYANGVLYKITEKQVVDFLLKTQKGVALDYIANFGRPIPKEVREKKIKADQLMVFDNYVVMHYDPDGQRFAKTKEEIAKERARKADPILFGVINGINNLYYIADWTDEYCDLTLEEFLKVSEIKKTDIKMDANAHVTYEGSDVTLK